MPGSPAESKTRRTSQISWDGRAYASHPTWTLDICTSELVLISEPGHLSRREIRFWAVLAILAPVISLAMFMLTTWPIDFPLAVTGVTWFTAYLSLGYRSCEVSGTGNEAEIALRVDGEKLYLGKPGLTFPRAWVERLECVVDYGDSFYEGRRGEGSTQLYSEINLVLKDPDSSEPGRTYRVVGAMGDACLPAARQIAAATGCELIIRGVIQTPG